MTRSSRFSPRRKWLLGVTAGALFMLSPFVVFFRYQGYSVWHPEIFVCFLVLAVIGVIAGLLMESFGQYTRPLVFSFLIALTFDIQLSDPERTRLLWYIFAISLAVTFLLRRHLARAGTAILTVMLFTSFFSSTGPPIYSQNVIKEADAPNPGLPIVLHIILDGQIGVEGIPVEFDSTGAYAEGLRDTYLNRGFRVFGRVFTRYFNTRETMGKLFNFDARGYRTKYHQDKRDGFFLKKNAYFDLMRDRGYQIHVYQSEFAEYCGENLDQPEVVSCYTQSIGAVSMIQGSALPIVDKVRIILGVYSRLSTIFLDLQIPSVRLWPLAAMGLFDRVREDLLRASPGSMFLVHFLLPHSPYAYDADCQVRDDPWTWQRLADRRLPGQPPSKLRNDEKTWATRYPLYLEQVVCTNNKVAELLDALEDAGMLDNMEILVHGDHGSRISFKLPDNARYGLNMRRRDYIDVFSTLFAYRRPGTHPEYDRRMLPLGPLFQALVEDNDIPAGLDWAGARKVHWKGGGVGKYWQRYMPEFSRDLNAYGDASR